MHRRTLLCTPRIWSETVHVSDLQFPASAPPNRTAADALLIVPPFHPVTTPSLAVHVLQACAREAGLQVEVCYANLLLAHELGTDVYTSIGFPRDYPPDALLGEWLFARSAYGHRCSDPLFSLEDAFGPAWAQWLAISRRGANASEGFSEPALTRLEERVGDWAQTLARDLAGRRYPIIGCSTMFSQTNASLALLRGIKAHDASAVTLLGGANCEGEMAAGIASLDPDGEAIDFVFSGESEATFVRFLRDYLDGRAPGGRIVRGEPCADLDALPTPDFAEYFDQLATALPQLAQEPDRLTLPYESSRGCSWAQMHPCTFCGINGSIQAFRQKDPQRVAYDLAQFAGKYPTRRVDMADSAMPRRYVHTLLPGLARTRQGLSIGYGVRADLRLIDFLALGQAGVDTIQPGIEALSTSLLRRMRKGTRAHQNIAQLRYARTAGLRVQWALLWGFPGDRRDDYEQTLALLPLLRHLPPPGCLLHLSVDRFSLYFCSPERYGLSELRPLDSYRTVFPQKADIGRIAYHFTAEYACDSHEHLDLIQQIATEVDAWQAAWTDRGSPPILHVAPAGGGRYVLFDTRGPSGLETVSVLNEDQAATALAGGPDGDARLVAWALKKRVVVALDGRYCPLATADPELLLMFEETYSVPMTGRMSKPRQSAAHGAESGRSEGRSTGYSSWRAATTLPRPVR